MVKCIVVDSLHAIFWVVHKLWNANPTDGLRFIHKFHSYVLWAYDVSSHTTITYACTSCKGSIMLSLDLHRRKFSSFVKRSIGRHFFILPVTREHDAILDSSGFDIQPALVIEHFYEGGGVLRAWTNASNFEFAPL